MSDQITGGGIVIVAKRHPTEDRISSAGRRCIVIAVAGILVDAALWSGKVLPDAWYRTMVANEWLLLLFGPPFAVAYRTWFSYSFAVIGSSICLGILVFSLRMRGSILKGNLWFAGTLLWLAFGLLAVAPSI